MARWKKNGTDWLYCCVGSDYGNDYSSACADGADPFSLASASLIYGVAALSTAEVISGTATSTATFAPSESPATATAATASETSTSKGETCPDSAQIGAIGAGVGVSLGVISISAIVWALWERRQRRRAAAAQVVTFSKPGYEVSGGFHDANASTPSAYSPHLYNTSTSLARPHELGLSEHKVELPGSITTMDDRRG